tara:strand:- start:743 stop:916 length:174 start_codon:yes stop_codon:yes gene_type:complete
MADDTPLTFQDVATVLALIDGPQGGKLSFAQGDMEVHVEKTTAELTLIDGSAPPEDS